MQITLIAALAQNRVIGREGGLPWHLPADLKHFKQQTVNKPVLMGRLTYESIGRPLPRRKNIVLTRQRDFRPDGVDVFSELDAVFASLVGEPELMVIGGGQVYEQCLGHATRMLLTIVMAEPSGDAFFPNFVAEDWFVSRRVDHPADDRNEWAYSFIDLSRDASGFPLPHDFPRHLPDAV